MKTKSKLSAKILKSKCPLSINKAMLDLKQVEIQLKESLKKVRKMKEDKVLPTIVNDPGHFYTYAKSF